MFQMLLLVLLLDLARAVEVTIPFLKVNILGNKTYTTYPLILPHRKQQMIFVIPTLIVAMKRVATCTLLSQATLTF